MKLDDELEKLKNDIPEDSLNYNEIYQKASLSPKHKYLYKKRFVFLSLAILTIFIISFSIIFPIVKINNDNTNSEYTNEKLVSLIQNVSTKTVSAEHVTYDEFINKYNIFCEKIAAETINNGENNVVSPYSIFSCLVLLSTITDNNSKKEILDALDMTEELILNNYPYFYSKHNYENDSKYYPSKEKTYNSIWIQNNLPINRNTINSLTNNFYCYPYYINYKDNQNANNVIKQYVSNNTEGLIEQDFNFTVDTIISLLNVNYLKDVWHNGSLRVQHNTIFKNIDNVDKKMDFNITDYGYGQIAYEENYSHFYTTTHKYKIKFILPNYSTNIHDIFNQETIANVNNYKYKSYDDNNEYYTCCKFPSFSLESELIILNDILKNKFGIKDIFGSNADLSKLLTDVTAFVSKIEHKAKLELNDDGIKAAAVTAAVVESATAAEEKPKNKIYSEFILNRSFGVIVTNSNNEIIYTGIVDRV